MKNVLGEGSGMSSHTGRAPEIAGRRPPQLYAMWRMLFLLAIAFIGGVSSAKNLVAQCQNTFTAVPLNVTQTYTFVTDPTNTSTFASTPCDPYGKGVFDTFAHASLPEQAQEGPIVIGQIIGTTYGNYYVGGTPGAEYIQFAPTSNPGFAYVNIVTYWVKTGLGPLSNTITFTVNAAPLPTVTAVSTNAGPTTGGTSFTLTGTNFTGATGVSFGGTAATSFTVNSATTITVTSPAHAAGVIDITVTTPNGSSATSSDDQFTFVTPPAITSLSPTSGTTLGGTVITITGTNLSNATQILFNGTAGTGISSTATSATVTTPAHAAGQVDVTLVTAGGTSPLNTGDHYTFIAPPTAGASSATVAYNSSANAVTLNTSGGPTSVAVASAASHGTATASGTNITYTPTTGFFGSDTFTYTATNSAGTSTAATVTLTVTSPPITVTPTSPPSGTFGTAYSQTLSASGGQSPYTFATTIASGALPTGLSLSSTGVISGTPTAAGTYTFTVSGTDSSTTTHANFTSTTITLVIAPIAPGVPGIGTATAGNMQASVAFTAPSSNGGAAITSYTATSSPGGFTAAGSSSPLTVTGLTNGTAYTFTVTATNSAGTGAASAASNSVTPIGMPIAGATSKTVAYNSSSNSVTLNLSGGAATSVTVASAASHGTATASGTTITYTPVTGFFGSDSFTYTATNGFGTSSAATVSITVSAPTITVTPTNPPSGVGLVAYSQQLTATGGQAPYTFSTTVASGALPSGFTLSSTGLISGTTLVTGTYTFTVTGTDSSTLTHATFTSTTITLIINSGLPLAPGAPTIGSATAGSAQATVTFTPPGSNGGAVITSYTVTSNPSGITATGSASPITVTGLTNGVAYAFTVTATNSAGTGLPSFASNSVTPIAPPIAGATSAAVAYGSSANSITLNLTGGAPTSVAVVASATHGTATASGTTITYTPATGYYGTDTFTFNATNGSGTSSTAIATITTNGPVIAVTPTTLTSDTVGSAYSQTLSGNGGQAPYTFSTTVASGALPPGMALMGNGAITGTPTTAGTYIFAVSGTDSSTPTHAGFTSSTITLTINAVLAGAPTIGTATAGDSQATVTFTPPASNGGSSIASYTVTSSPGGITATGSASPITVTGLANGTTYTFTVTATNAAGVSSASSASNAVTPLGAPIAGATSATVAYDSSANPITLNLTGTAATSVAVTSTASHGAATASGTTITYTPTTGYFGPDSFTYTATNAVGISSAAPATITVSAPTIVVSPTTLPTGMPLTAYSQSLTASGGQTPYTFATTVASGALPPGLTLSSTGAITGTPTLAGIYTFTVSGTDSSTATHANFTSATIALSITLGYPGPPTIGTATLGNAQATVSFTPPASNGGSPVLYYTVTSSPGGITTTGTASPITVGGLSNGTAYTFTVTATNAVGTGNASAPSNSVTPLAPLVAGAVSATVAYDSTASPITLNLSGGAAASVAVASAASHGTATASGTTITYTPTIGYFGSDSFTYTATNASGTSSAATVSITVSAPNITVTPTNLAAGTYNTAYSQNFTATGGQSPYAFSITVASGALPAGLTLSSAGAITGTPTASGTFTFTVSGTDSSTATHATFTSSTITLTIAGLVPGAPTIGTASLVSGQASVTFTPPASNGGATITSYTVTSSPGGITATGSNSPITVPGLTNGTAYTFTVTATNSAGTGPASTPSNSITPVAPPVAGAVSATVAYNSNANPITLNLSGGTVASVAVASAATHGTATASGTTIIIYTPAAGYFGSDSFTYTATNANGTSSAATVSITVSAPTISVTPTTLPSGTVTTAYSQTLTANGGQAPYTFSTTVASGNLPPGLTLSSTGVLTGTPTLVGPYPFTVTGTDSSTLTHATFTSATITISVTALLPGSPTIGTATAGNTQATVTFAPPSSTGGSAITSYTVTSSPGGITATGSASPVTVTGLTNGTAYIFTVTATNSIGTGPASAASNSITPIAPPIAGVVSATVAYDSTVNPVTLNLAGGATTSVAVPTAAGHGTATASGSTITYTPTTGFFGSDSFTYTATNGSGTSSPATVTITVSAPTITVTPTTLPAGTDGTAYSQTLAATGGQAPYIFATTVASGALPAGLTLSSTGSVTGTPTASGTFTLTVTGTDSSTATHANFTSAAITLTIAASAPGAPAIGTATAGDSQATVTFTAPASNGGSTITSYTVTSSPGGLTGTGPTSPITITGLTNGAAYNFTVTATNGTGTGPASAASNSITPKATQTITFTNPGTQSFNTSPTLSATASSGLAVTFTSTTPAVCAVTAGGQLSFVTAGTCTIAADQSGNATYAAATTVTQSLTVSATAPGAPTIGTATAGNTQATVTFTAPASTGGVPIITYIITSSPGGLTATGSSSPVTVTGLTNGTAYTFTVTATNSVGTSAVSAVSNSITPTSSITAGATTATVAYNAIASPITLNLSGGAPTSVAVITPATHGTATASGTIITYTPTAGYYGPDGFTYTATNSSNTSGPATASITVSAPIIFVTPTILAAGTVNTAYGQTLSATGGKAPYNFSAGLASGALPTGLTLSTSGTITGTPTAAGTFNFTVTGSDSSTGSGPASFTSATLSLTINALLPEAPTVGTATPGNAQATVSFAPPASNGGSAITTYTVTSNPGGLTATGTTSPITLNGLTNGTAYTFTITATNSAGTGPSSTPSNSITPAAAPVAGAATATLAYNATASPITLNLSGGTATSVTVATAATHGSATASGTTITYTPTTGYYGSDSFTYTATNGTATSTPATVSITISPPTISVAPTTLPAGTDGSFYAQTLTPSGGQSPYTFSTALASGTLPAGVTLSTTGVLSGTPTAAGIFTFTVSGTDSSTGSGPATFTSASLSLTITAVLPGAPIAGTATAGDMQATVAFTPPASLGGDLIVRQPAVKPQLSGSNPPVNYTATSSPGGVTGTSTTSPILVTGLTNGTTYTFTIAATNSAGTGPTSAPTNAITPQGPQTITFANPGPQVFGTVPILAATSTSSLAVAFTSATTAVCAITTSGILTFLSAGSCTIKANQSGNAAFTAATQVSQTFAVSAIFPGTATLLAASAGNGQSTISFTPPVSTGGSPITVYTVNSNPGGITATGTGSPITISGLTNGTTYTFTITATNIAGTGLSSLPSNSITPSASVTATQAIASTTLTQNHAATAFTPVLGGSGTAPLTYSVSPALPAGLTLSTTTGAIIGTPTVAGPAATYTVTVTDANLALATGNFSLTVNIAVSTIPGTAVPTVTQGVAVTPFTPITGSGGTAPSTYTVSPALPAGLSINPATGQITGTPTSAGAATVYTVTVTDINGATSTATFTLAVTAPFVAGSKSVTAAYNSNGTTSTAIDLTNSITDGTPTSVALVASPSHGTAAVSGLIVTYTPTRGYYGSDGFTYTASAASLISNIGTVSITIPAPIISAASSTLPGGTIGVVYSQTLAPTGGAAPYIFSTTITSGTLPAGLTLSSTGVLSGTPATACTCNFTITGTDSSTPPATFSLTLSLTIVGGAPTVTAVAPNLGLAAGGTTVTITGTNLTDTSIVSFGNVPATSVTYVNATTLTAVVPAGTGVVDVTVTTAGGTSPATPADQFTYLAQAGALSNPLGTTVDGNGDTFIADSSLGYIVEVPAGCTSITCEKIIGGGLNGLTGVTVDSNGNLVVLSGGSAGTVTKFLYDAATNSYGAPTTIGTGLNLPTTTPSGIAVDDMGNIYYTDTADHTVIEEPYNNATGTYGAPITLTIGSSQSTPTGITTDAYGDVFYTDPGTGTIDELTPGSSTPIVLATGVNAQSVTIDASGNIYYTDPVTNTVTRIPATSPYDGSSYGTGVVIATGLSTPYGISVDDNGNLLVANNGTRALVKVAVSNPPSFTFASTKVGATSTDSPQTATLANIGTAALTFPPTSAANPALTSGYVLVPASTCPQITSSSSAQTIAEGASCTYAVSFTPAVANIGTDTGTLTATDDNLNLTGATQSIPLTAVALPDDTSTVTLTLSPVSPIVFDNSVAITAAIHDTTVPATIPTGSVTFTLTDPSAVETTIASAALTAGSATVPTFKPTAAGTYTLTANYTGAIGDIASSAGTVSLVVTKATPTLAYTPSPATQTFGTPIPATALNATAIDATGTPIPGTFTYTTTVASTATTLIGGSTILPAATYAITATFNPTSTVNYTSGGTVTATYKVMQSTAAIALSNLSFNYNAQPHSATATTTPADLTVALTYNGSATPPTQGGSYTVVATIADTVNYSGSASGTLVIARVPVDSVTLIANPNPVLTTTPVTLTATVTSSLGTPTGTVNFIETGTGTVFGAVPLVNGVATFTTSAEPLGIYNLVATYLGDTDFLPLTSPVFTSTVLDFTLGLSTAPGSTSTVTADPGGTAIYAFSLAPDGSPTFTDPVTFTISGQPGGSTYTITPSVIPAGSGPTPVALAITLPQNSALLHNDGRELVPFALALLLLPFARRMRRTGKRLVRLVSLAVFLAVGIGITGGLSSCGPASGFYGGSRGGPQPGSKTYTITLTGTSGKLTHSTTVTLTVP